MLIVLLFGSSCSEDEPSIQEPLVTAPESISVITGFTKDITFSYVAAGGLAHASVSSISGSAAIVKNRDLGDTSGEIVVSFSTSTVGTTFVTVSVTDAAGRTDNGTAAITVMPAEMSPIVIVDGNIEENTTWTANNVYQLDSRVTVVPGVTLTIEAGTVIKGSEGQGAASSALLIARGATLNASGTSELPIIFTSVHDLIEPSDIAAGNYASSTSASQVGLWGGIIILGKAPISASNENDERITEVQIEGIPATDSNGLYGGEDETDNSGTITYISIRHGGANIGAGNELNGLTLGGVGSGTTINNVEVVANADDGIEWFGGNVSVENVLIWNSNDDGLDTDQDWIGTCTNFMVITPVGGSAFELDGPEGSTNRGTHQFDNGVVYAGDLIDHIVDWDDNTNAGLSNIYFFGIGELGNFESFGGDGTGDNSGWETNLASGSPVFDGVAHGVVTFDVPVTSKSKGPTASDFTWTWAGNSGTLTDLGL